MSSGRFQGESIQGSGFNPRMRFYDPRPCSYTEIVPKKRRCFAAPDLLAANPRRGHIDSLVDGRVGFKRSPSQYSQAGRPSWCCRLAANPYAAFRGLQLAQPLDRSRSRPCSSCGQECQGGQSRWLRCSRTVQAVSADRPVSQHFKVRFAPGHSKPLKITRGITAFEVGPVLKYSSCTDPWGAKDRARSARSGQKMDGPLSLSAAESHYGGQAGNSKKSEVFVCASVIAL